jgi:hypothetical protein
MFVRRKREAADGGPIHRNHGEVKRETQISPRGSVHRTRRQRRVGDYQVRLRSQLLVIHSYPRSH